MNLKTGIAACALGLLAISSALAQTTPPPVAGSKEAIPEKKAEPLQGGQSESLSNKLNRTDGVIKPTENVDPGMKTPAPDSTPHSTPVIPPSATGGQNAK